MQNIDEENYQNIVYLNKEVTSYAFGVMALNQRFFGG
jgi:hypothetical protein